MVGEGAVVRAFSKATKAVTRVAQGHRGRRFTVTDLVEAVECSRRTVRRVLNELAELGHLEKRETNIGLANEFRTVEEPGDGEIELPDLNDPFAPSEDTPTERTTRGHSTVDPDDSVM